MSYGYTSSQPNLTVLINTESIQALETLAKQLGYIQSRGATAGRGSLSALVNAIGHAASTTRGLPATARNLHWLKGAAPDSGSKTSKRILVEPQSISALRNLATKLEHVATGGRQHGQGSISSLVNALAAKAKSEATTTAKQLDWLKK